METSYTDVYSLLVKHWNGMKKCIEDEVFCGKNTTQLYLKHVFLNNNRVYSARIVSDHMIGFSRSVHCRLQRTVENEDGKEIFCGNDQLSIFVQTLYNRMRRAFPSVKNFQYMILPSSVDTDCIVERGRDCIDESSNHINEDSELESAQLLQVTMTMCVNNKQLVTKDGFCNAVRSGGSDVYLIHEACVEMETEYPEFSKHIDWDHLIQLQSGYNLALPIVQKYYPAIQRSSVLLSSGSQALWQVTEASMHDVMLQFENKESSEVAVKERCGFVNFLFSRLHTVNKSYVENAVEFLFEIKYDGEYLDKQTAFLRSLGISSINDLFLCATSYDKDALFTYQQSSHSFCFLNL